MARRPARTTPCMLTRSQVRRARAADQMHSAPIPNIISFADYPRRHTPKAAKTRSALPGGLRWRKCPVAVSCLSQSAARPVEPSTHVGSSHASWLCLHRLQFSRTAQAHYLRSLFDTQHGRANARMVTSFGKRVRICGTGVRLNTHFHSTLLAERRGRWL